MAQAVDDSLSVLGCPPALAIELTRALKTGQTTTAVAINGCGVPYPTAVEIARQVNGRSGSSIFLANAGVSAILAGSMATAITNGPA